eukprot:c27856_g1_i1 orf=440-2497(+)
MAEVAKVLPETAEAVESALQEEDLNKTRDSPMSTAEAAKEEKIVEAVASTEQKTKETEEANIGEKGFQTKDSTLTSESRSIVPSSKDESYSITELKASEKKALQFFKLKVEEAIKAKSFVNALVKAQPTKGTREVKVVRLSEESDKKGESAAKVEADVQIPISATKETETKAEETISKTLIGATKETEVKAEETIVKDEGFVTSEATSVTETPPLSTYESPPPDAASCAATVLIDDKAKEEAQPVTNEVKSAVVKAEEDFAEKSAATFQAKEDASTPVPDEPPVLVKREVPPSSATGEFETVQESTSQAPGETIVGKEVTIDESSREVVVQEAETTPPEFTSLWGVPLLEREGDERTDVILLKFLRARDGKVDEAFSMIQNTMIWRKDFGADRLLEEDFGTEFDTVAYMHGYDKEGHPVCYNHYGVFKNRQLYQQLFEDESKFHNFLRWRIQVLEMGIQKLNFTPGGANSLVQVTDLKGSPGFMKWRNITKKALAVLQDNYPELLAKQIFINAPWYFGTLYSIYGQSITQRQRSKVVVARPGKVTETLFKYISPEYVPVKYGGLSRLNDTDFEGVDAPVKEFTVKAGEKQFLEIQIAESGTTAVWDLAVVGWEVVYGGEFIPNAEEGYTVIIQKPKKVAASEEGIRSSFKAMEPGKIVLMVDNSTSRRKRLAVHRYVVNSIPPKC